MTITWVRTDNDNVFSALEAVERALATGDTGTPPTAEVVADLADPAAGDAYLAENLALARATWPVDPHRIVESRRPGLGVAINAFQRLVRRATWWYALPQWQQISEFHAALVRIVDSLLEHQRQLRVRLTAVEAAYISRARMQVVEEQISALLAEQQQLRHRIAELESRLARYERASRPDGVSHEKHTPVL
jgi:hypothetical protein